LNKIRIPVYKPEIGAREKEYVNECLDSTWVSSRGRFIGEFEERFSTYLGVAYGATTSNGTVALHLALLAIGIGPGDEVLVPSLTYIASVNAIRYCNAVPVLVDSEKQYWQIDPIEIRKKISSKTKAILVVHLYGHACDMDAIMKISNECRIPVVEDCAEAIGTKYDGHHVGTFGVVSTFSFFGNKTITTGEGGMVVSNSKDIISKVKHLRGQGLAEQREYWHDTIGYNYRMTNIQAAIGLAQLEKLDGYLEKKRFIGEYYRQSFRGYPLSVHSEGLKTRHSFWMVSVLVSSGSDRDPLRRHLAEAGIETRPVFYPAHRMPMYLNSANSYPIADELADRGINLPSWPGLSELDLVCIVDSVKTFLNLDRRIAHE
jgi:perosamine synthetase